ncbi:MFS transporter [Brevibacterium samyangense]|uniref:MFS transporter n=1 Tax=Brevibacterium samyangense TaxID=366888 RepID=UPI0031DC5DFA
MTSPLSDRPTYPRSVLVLVLIGVVAAGFNLRPGVTGLSPLLDMMAADVRIGAVFLSIIGMLPPLAYGVVGIVTPRLVRRFGSVSVLAVGTGLVFAGSLVRLRLPEATPFLLLSALALVGMGIGNVVIPPIVKEFFPHRVALLSTVHVAVLQFGTFFPPLVAVPLALVLPGGWRGSLAVWAVTSGLALLVWVLVRLRAGGSRTGPEAPRAPGTPSASADPSGAPSGAFGRILRSPRAWSLMVLTGLSSFHNFILFTWHPLLFVRAGLSESTAGIMLGILCVIPFVLGLGLPVWAARIRTPVALVWVFCGFTVAGYLGMWFAPVAAPLLWTVLLGLGVSTFPLALALVNLRSARPEDTAALSGFVQGAGYLLAATGPFLFGFLIDLGGGAPAFLLALGAVLVQAVVARTACRPGFI